MDAQYRFPGPTGFLPNRKQSFPVNHVTFWPRVLLKIMEQGRGVFFSCRRPQEGIALEGGFGLTFFWWGGCHVV